MRLDIDVNTIEDRKPLPEGAYVAKVDDISNEQFKDKNENLYLKAVIKVETEGRTDIVKDNYLSMKKFKDMVLSMPSGQTFVGDTLDLIGAEIQVFLGIKKLDDGREVNEIKRYVRRGSK